jgi:hypothetical protein
MPHASRAREALLLALVLASACSPEARRERDGGPGADPGNKRLVPAPRVDPVAADTTLWPGRAPAPVELLARGEMPPPAGVTTMPAATARDSGARVPATPATKDQERSFDRGTSANPRRPSTTRP